MSDTAQSGQPRAPRLETLAIGAVCLIVLIGGWYLFSQQQQSLRRSPTGLDGLQIWLKTNGVSAQNFTGGWLMDQTAIGLMVIPLYDTALDAERPYPASKEELLQQQDEYDLGQRAIAEKAKRVPVLVVLPKWRSGMRLTGLAHPTLRAEKKRITETLGKIVDVSDPDLVLAPDALTDFRYTSADGKALNATIYAAQMFKADGCTPVLGTDAAMLLAECPLKTRDLDGSDSVLVLSDPDLLNNHGLRLGDNARIVLDLIRERTGDKNVVIDYSSNTWLRDPRSAPERERTWGDLLRFFEPPFLSLWFGGAFLLALCLWRGGFRYGPVLRDGAPSGSGKLTAVRARARLMRLSGQDGELVREYAAARLSATATALFGPAHAAHYARRDEFLRYTERRHPQSAGRLRAALDEIGALPAHLPAAAAARQIDTLEQVLETIIHDA